jgi:toxin ParE1/3/4
MSAHKPGIRFTPKADDDLKSISLYTWRSWGEEQATIYEAMIEKALEMLREHPRIGKVQDDLFPGCRSIRVEQHVVYYHQPQLDEVEIVRICASAPCDGAFVGQPAVFPPPATRRRRPRRTPASPPQQQQRPRWRQLPSRRGCRGFRLRAGDVADEVVALCHQGRAAILKTEERVLQDEGIAVLSLRFAQGPDDLVLRVKLGNEISRG